MNIDSDKLLEWIGKNTVCLGAPGGATWDCSPKKLRDAIQSGELAAKRVYARAPDDIDDRGWIKPGHEYPVDDDDGDTFVLYETGFGPVFCKWENCAHLNGGNWERVEK